MTTPTFDPARTRALLALGTDWLADQLGFDSRADRHAFVRAHVDHWLPLVARNYEGADPAHPLTVFGDSPVGSMAKVLDDLGLHARLPEQTSTVRIHHATGAIEVRRGLRRVAPWTDYVQLATLAHRGD